MTLGAYETSPLGRTVLKQFQLGYQAHARIARLLHASMMGLGQLTLQPETLAVLRDIEDGDGYTDAEPITDERIAHARAIAEFSQAEIDGDYPLLHAQALISAWSNLETTIRNVVLEFTESGEYDEQNRVIQRLAVNPIRFSRLSPRDQAVELVRLIYQELRTPLGGGVGPIEGVLDVYGLAGGVEKEVRDILYEAHMVRNVLVHRMGLADERFVRSMPKYGVAVGDQIAVSHRKFAAYDVAIQWYTSEIYQRCRVRLGYSRLEETEDHQRDYLECLVRALR